MNIVFFGASELGFLCCEALIKSGATISGIFTIPQEFSISYSASKVRNVLHKDFHVLGKEYNIPVVNVDANLKSLGPEFERMKADLIVAIGWYYLIPSFMINNTAKGAIGIHASLLPKYRGNAPLVWALINGEKETGVSLFYFSEKTDEGDIIAQERFEIKDSDSIAELLEKTKKTSLKIVLEEIPKIASGQSSRTVQSNSAASYFPARSPDDGKINWADTAYTIRNFIRAQTKPYPGAFTLLGANKIMIWKAEEDRNHELSKNAKEGTILSVGTNYMRIACKSSVLKVTEWDMTGNEQISEGQLFNS